MKSRLKSVLLNSIKLEQHPLLNTLISENRFSLNQSPSIQFLSVEHLQCLLHSFPIPVLKQEKEGHYFILATMPILDMIRSHKASIKLKVSLIIYDEPELIISTLTLIKPALLLPEFRCLPQQLHSRLEKAKLLKLAMPSKKQLSHLAQISPSCIRE
ncbi:hypothetical protein [Shewanella sp. 10N.286.48.A6]|uniref:hypothetical protein n=1 Tax=Shewanella sp. 10N.286.48.A6 TaxID=1880833 RepID=UPI000C849AA0|nr:hypothetical protein [Shewanella sp. 10N.286.48.A6]PMI02826.1 hypothetical protein BCU55_04395 [Shewanella sp. 10N.286.48.A6]